jgi:hypothetical protein
MKIMALKQLQQSNPAMYDPKAIDIAAMKAMGWSNPEQFMAPPEASANPPPQVMQAMEELKIKKQEADAKTMLAQAKVQESQMQEGQAPDPVKMAELQIEQREIEMRGADAKLDAFNRLRDRESRERLAAVRLAEDIAKNPASLPIIKQLIEPSMLSRLESQEQPFPAGIEGIE